MSDDRVFEIEVRVRSGKAGDEAVKHLEGSFDHRSADDVALDVVAHLDSRARNKLRHVPGTDR